MSINKSTDLISRHSQNAIAETATNGSLTKICAGILGYTPLPMSSVLVLFLGMKIVIFVKSVINRNKYSSYNGGEIHETVYDHSNDAR